ncbi:hypothetical protein ASE74_17075 [Pedobacter sp. Leaf216]|uniref:hypothetical protein n=1 Tax=Pedobacter sp. Leaf216 TaxID=1735684 RepID=UPI0006FC8FA3|nr:hypothetical protein [Pedobacter sp. Leaf216]KQM76982.1 hypothetical protein ASE74_17075 [Pedobacter sp. Leaf216]
MRGDKQMSETINVLVHLPDFGIIDLPIAYTLNTDHKRPGVSIANCKILLDDENLPEWLFTTTFSIAYTSLADGIAYMVSVSTDWQSTNRSHETMLSIVSSYIKLNEDKMALNRQMAHVEQA